jgi:hypothetical protein
VRKDNGVRLMKNVFSILLLIILVLSLLPISSLHASIYVYPPTQVSTKPTEPPIIFQDPGTPGVSVNLGPNRTSANVYVSLSYSIQLQTNPVVYYSTLDQGLPPGWSTFSRGSGTPGWYETPNAWVGNALAGAITLATGNALNGAYYNNPILNTNYNGFYNVSAYIWPGGLSPSAFNGIAYIESNTRRFYGCGIGYNGNLFISKRISQPSVNVLISTQNLGLGVGRYLLICSFNPSTKEIWAYLYRPLSGSLIASIYYKDTNPPLLNPDSVGFFIAISGSIHSPSSIYTSFDELVVTQNADPLRIIVNNVPSGWNVSLYNGSTLLESVISTGSPVVLNRFWNVTNTAEELPNTKNQSTILKQGRIEVYDNNGNLKAVYGSTLIIGNQVFELSVQASNVRILNIGNTDSKNYYGILTLHSYSSSGFSSISIYLCNPSTCSTPITIPPGSMQTSEVVLPLQGVSYIMLDYSASSIGASADIYIHLRYSSLSGQNGVLAIYPVEIHVG